MDFYMVVWIDPGTAMHLDEPEFEESKGEAIARAKALTAKYHERCYAVYRCEEVFATTPSA